jgi:hypothetical protein
MKPGAVFLLEMMMHFLVVGGAFAISTSAPLAANVTSGINKAVPDPTAIAAFYKKVGSSPDAVRAATKLDWSVKHLNDFDSAVMAYIFTSMGALPLLEMMFLGVNEIGDDGVKSLADALGKGALPALKELSLRSNQIANPGMISFAEAISKGASPALARLWLQDNQIGDAGLSALAEAMGKGGLPALDQLSLSHNQIGDTGLAAFASVISSGALPALEILYLYNNNIGDTGLAAFAEAIGKGALPALNTLYIDSPTKELKDICSSKHIKLNPYGPH